MCIRILHGKPLVVREQPREMQSHVDALPRAAPAPKPSPELRTPRYVPKPALIHAEGLSAAPPARKRQLGLGPSRRAAAEGAARNQSANMKQVIGWWGFGPPWPSEERTRRRSQRAKLSVTSARRTSLLCLTHCPPSSRECARRGRARKSLPVASQARVKISLGASHASVLRRFVKHSLKSLV